MRRRNLARKLLEGEVFGERRLLSDAKMEDRRNDDGEVALGASVLAVILVVSLRLIRVMRG